MGGKKRILLVLLVIFIGIQFIRPARNKSAQALSTDFAKVFVVPENIQSALQTACYDCHSNNTVYPWYSNVQPIAWWMANHIKEGKSRLNFSEFGNYAGRKQISKLKEIANQIEDDEMPLTSYKIIHRNTGFSKEKKEIIINWMNKTADSLSTND